MKNIKLTTIADKTVLLNWDNVDYVKYTTSHFGDCYSEIHCGDQIIDVKESVEEIEGKLGPGPTGIELLEEEARQQYNECGGTVTEKL